MSFTTAWLYVDDDGEFHVTIGSGKPHLDGNWGWYFLGQLEPDTGKNPREFFEWIANECPDKKYPDALTDAEIEEVRQTVRDNLLGLTFDDDDD